jgi:Cdc6-like AAA superfamily ATPase
LNLVAQKVSIYSGDIRRSLQITKRAVEICRDQHQAKPASQQHIQTLVNYEHVLAAFDELFNSKSVKVLSSLKKAEVIIVLALYNELDNRKVERVNIDHV